MIDAPEKESELMEVRSPVTEYVRADLYAALEAKLAEAMKELKSIEEKSAQTAYGSDHTICYTCAENLEQVREFLKENENREAPQGMERLFAEAMKVIEPFAEAAGAMDNLHGPDLSDTTRVRPGIYMGELRAARDFMKENGNGE